MLVYRDSPRYPEACHRLSFEYYRSGKFSRFRISRRELSSPDSYRQLPQCSSYEFPGLRLKLPAGNNDSALYGTGLIGESG